MAIDSNTVTLSFTDITITNITFNGTIEVTPGQANSPPPTITHTGSGLDTVWTITLLADRQNNSGVATDFINDTGGTGGAFAHQFSPVKLTAPDFPSELNFFFGIDLNTPSLMFSVDLGQGNTGFPTFHNNWWIGSVNLANMSNAQSQSAQLTLNDGSILNIQGGVSNFDFSPAAAVLVPEPATWVLMAAGLASVALVLRLAVGLRTQAV